MGQSQTGPVNPSRMARRTLNLSRRPASFCIAAKLIEADDIAAVLGVLKNDLLTSGPAVAGFEADLAAAVEAQTAVACTNGTAALHMALAALDLGPGDVCIAPAITFLSTATAARFCGADLVFADVDAETGLMTAQTLAEAIKRAGPKAKAVLPVHLGGRACDMPAIASVARAAELRIVEDACHALGGRADGVAVGACAHSDAACFSFHGVRPSRRGKAGR